LKNTIDIEKELIFLGLLEKAKEIYSEFGERAVLSYIRASYRLLSKVYHPDLNPTNRSKAIMIQQRLNHVGHLISQMKDEELVELVKEAPLKQIQKKKKILVVEDETGLQELFQDVFLREGYDVRVASDGHSGYEVYSQFQPDLVFTDVIMPKMNGLELVGNIRRINPRIKVVYISGFLGIQRLRQQLEGEVLRYGYCALSKPFKISSMLNLVREYMTDSSNEHRRVNIFA
jgi:CheY-like chemotaxis protein